MVKSKTIDNLIADLTETFKTLKEYRWKPDPTKCIFGVPSCILLGNIISRCGIEGNLEKIEAVTKMKPLTYVKDIQKLTGCDEDITLLDVPADPPTVMQGPMTRARMHQLNLEVSSFLSDHFHTFENRLLPNDVILLRNIGEGP